MLRLAFRCSLNHVRRARPCLVRGAKPSESSFAVDSDRAQKMFVGAFSIREERNRLLATVKTAPAKTEGEPPIVGSSGTKPQDSWVPRPNFEEKVLRNFNTNWTAFQAKSNRPNDFQGIMIPGGVGVGKTRAGQEIPHIVAKNIDENIKLIWHISLDYRHFYDEIPLRKDDAMINPANLLFGLFREAMVSDQTQITSEQVASVLPISLMELVQDFSNMKQLDSSDNAVLYLHIDEFQRDPARVTLVSREVGLYLMDHKVLNVLAILVLTGIGSQEFFHSCLPTHYKVVPIHLQLSVENNWLNGLVDQFMKRKDRKRQQRIIQFRKKNPETFFKLLKTTGGIPIFIWRLLHSLHDSLEGSPVNAAQAAFEDCCQYMQRYHSGGRHLDWFHKKDNVMLLLQKAFFKEHVTHGYKLNELTVGDLEENGRVYLERVQGTHQFTIGLPLMMFHSHASDLNLFTGLDYLAYPFKSPDDTTNYEDCIAQIYTFLWRLLSYQKTTEVTLQYLHRDCLTADKELLRKKITLLHADWSIGIQQMKTFTKDSSWEFELMGPVGKYQLHKPATFVLRTRKKFAGADVVIPGQLQIKWIPDGNLTEDSVKNELKNTLPEMPLVIISPKVPQIALQKACAAGYYPQLCLVTDQKCIQFFEPFFTLDSTAENLGEEIQVPEGRNELTEATPAKTTKTKKGTQSSRKKKEQKQ